MKMRTSGIAIVKIILVCIALSNIIKCQDTPIANCFYDSVGNIITRLKDNISRYSALFNINTDTNIALILNAASALAEVENYKDSSSVDSSALGNLEIVLNTSSSWSFITQCKTYLDAVKVSPKDGVPLISGVWTSLQNDWMIHYSKSSYPANFEKDVWRIVMYIKSLAKIKFKYTDPKQCLPSTFELINSIDELPMALATEEYDPSLLKIKEDINSFTMDPLYLVKGVAVTFWTTQSLQELLYSNKITLMEGYAGNVKVYDMTLTKNGESVMMNNLYIGDETINFQTYANCAEYAQVQLYFEKGISTYKMTLTIKYLSTNSRYSYTKDLPAFLVEGVNFSFNRPWVVNGVKVFKNFEYSENKEISLFNYGTDLNQLELIKTWANACAKTVPECKYMITAGCMYCIEGMLNLSNTCVFACPDGWFTNQNKCQQCYDKCLKCTGPNIFNCLECQDPLVLFGTTCQVACPDNMYPTNKVCGHCQDNCSFCLDATKCKVCKPDFYLHKGSCVNECPVGYYKTLNPNACLPCADDCLECTDVDKCMICKDGHFLYNGICESECPIKTWTDSTNKICPNCPENCLTCTDSIICNKCTEGFILQPGGRSCLNSCPDGSVAVNGICTSCTDLNCWICDADHLNICTQCMNSTFLKNGECVSTCGDGYYLDSVSRMCLLCHYDPNCLSCNSEKCLACSPGYLVLEGQTCVTTCPDGYIESGAACIKCSTPDICKKCSTTKLDVCTQCYNDKFLLNGNCADTCPDEFYANVDVCTKCGTGCKSCLDNFTCSKCNSNYMLKGTTCVTDCGSGFVNVDGLCTVCSTTFCDKCDAYEPNKCNSCQSKRYLYANKCHTTCPVGTFPTNTFNCQDCLKDCDSCINSVTCAKCSENLVNQDEVCTDTCSEGFVAISGRCRKCTNVECKYCDTTLKTCVSCPENKYLYKGNCISLCPDGTYLSEDKCLDCVKPCAFCTDEKTCLTCQPRFFLHGTTCTDICPVGTVRILIKCVPCTDVNCIKCSATSVDQCLTCKPGFFIFNGGCIETCPSGFYPLNGTCLPCFYGCLQCKNDKTCDRCEDNLNLLEGKSCVASCPDKYTRDIESNVCNKCKSTCLKCDGDITKCTACPATGNILLYQGDCLASCPDTTWANQGQCIPCDVANCSKCTNGATCTLCQNKMLLMENNCIVAPCPEGYAQISTNCLKCEVNNCKRCPVTKTCMDCNTGFFLASDNTCNTTCPNYFYANVATGKCDKCPALCVNCSDAKTCTKCDVNFYLLNGQCVKTCPEQYTIVDDNCVKCSVDKCKTCNSNTSICDICVNPFVLNKNECLKLCPETTFNKLGICTSCPESCSICTDENTCTKCTSPKLLQLDKKCGDTVCPDTTVPINGSCTKCLTEDACRLCNVKNLKLCVECKNMWPLLNNKCTQNCPDGYFQVQNTCNSCITRCKKCSNSLTCDECTAGFNLQSGKCALQCNKGFYAQNGRCIACEPNCETCDSTKCSKCASTVFLQFGKCVASCSVGTYPSNLKECLACPQNCNQCTNGTQCRVCAAGFYLKNGLCVESCGSGFSLNTSTASCVACGNGCDTCNSSAPSTCLKCKQPLVLNSGLCVDVCPVGTFTDNNSVCQKCILNCDVCSDTTTCLTCRVDFFLHPLRTSCSKTRFCGEGTRMENNVCVPCSVSGCQVCSTSSSTCTTCYPPLLKIDTVACVNSCPEGRFKSSTNCLKCPTSCKTCSDLNTCTACIDGMVLNKNKCVARCETGQVAISGVCQSCKTSNCASCDPTSNVCLTCMSPFFLLSLTNPDGSLNTSCVTNCGVGRFTSNRICTRCMSNCDVCVTNTSCTTCATSYVLQGLGCQTACDLGFANINGKCTRCTNVNCLTCSSSNLALCSKCTTGYSLLGTDCVTSCGSGFFKNLVNNSYYVCASCPTNCNTCTNATTCTACKTGFTLKLGVCV